MSADQERELMEAVEKLTSAVEGMSVVHHQSSDATRDLAKQMKTASEQIYEIVKLVKGNGDIRAGLVYRVSSLEDKLAGWSKILWTLGGGMAMLILKAVADVIGLGP